MPKIHLDPNATFRTSTSKDLLLFDALTPTETERLGDLHKSEEFWGVARSRDGAMLQVLGCEAALLLLSLQKPGRLPHFCSFEVNHDAVLRLVLDGLLEIRHGEGFVSGADALEAFGGDEGSGPSGYLAELSWRALRYGAALALDDAPSLAGRLYGYNRVPRTPTWNARLPDLAGVEAFLQLDEPTLRRELEVHWRRSDTRESWIDWQRRRPAGRFGVKDRERAPSYKLYISPHPNDLPRAFAQVVGTLRKTRASAFKVGNDAMGVLRPDKLIAYFSSFEDLADAASKLEPRLLGLDPQGVPFTPAISDDGLLSWGMDPPRNDRYLPSEEARSWRAWLCDQLSVGLVNGGGSWRLALERARLAGIDVETWTPDPTLFEPSTLEH